MLGQTLIATSGTVIFLMGFLHLIYTFASRKFNLRDAQLEAQLKLVSANISRETTMWKLWIGFNASHSMGAISFGAIYTYLAIFHYALLLQSGFLVVLGGLLLAGYLVLGKLYWFSAPFRGIALASALYAAGFAVAWA